MSRLNTQLSYLHNLRRFEKIKLGLATMESLMTALGNPEQQFNTIHIAGTNGKGSTAALLASALKNTSQTVGLYTSPFIRRFNERIAVNNQSITDAELSELITTVRAATTEHNLEPTYFEFITALAFLYFAKRQVDLAIIEVGMGGRLDATNIITPLVSVITNIDLDHTEWLGTTHRAIAAEKAGIIKDNVPAVTAETDPDILAYFKQICAEKNTTLFSVQEHLTARITNQTLDGQTFQTRGIIEDTFTIPLLGEHQVQNALTALLALHVLREAAGGGGRGSPDARPHLATGRGGRTVGVHGRRQDPLLKAAKIGFSQVRSPGRLDLISHDPFILIDGAHNESGFAALAHFLDTQKLPLPDVLVIGVKHDKDINALSKLIVPRFRHIIVTESSFQPMPATDLANRIKKQHRSVEILSSAKHALKKAQANLKPGGMLLIAGSLYLASDALTYFEQTKEHARTWYQRKSRTRRLSDSQPKT